jgi:hypothetical protein
VAGNRTIFSAHGILAKHRGSKNVTEIALSPNSTSINPTDVPHQLIFGGTQEFSYFVIKGYLVRLPARVNKLI